MLFNTIKFLFFMDELLDEKSYETRAVKYASFSQRSAAILIDLLLLILLSYGIYLIFGNSPTYPEFILKYWWQESGISSFYFIYFDGSEKNATPGKQIMDIRLLNTEKKDIGFNQSAKHFLFSLLLFFGYFKMLSNDKRQTIADKMSNIIVISR